MADKQAVFTLRVDTGNSLQDVQSFDQAVKGLNKDLQDTQNTASQQTGMDSFEAKLQELNERLEAGGMSMREMTVLMKEYQTLAAQSGQTSPVGQQAIQNAGELKDTIGDLKAATTALASDTVKLDTALAGIETGAAAFQGVQSAIALTGTESEALVQTMVKLQAAQGLVNSVQTIANNLQKDAILGIQLRTALEKAQAIAIGNSTGALKIFRIALAATGIGALIAGIGLLIANFDKLKRSVFGITEAQESLKDAQKEGAKAMADATMTVNEVGVAFEQAKNGIISKEQALKTYNEKLGATLGTTEDFNAAEKAFVENSGNYIKAVQARAIAQALAGKAAEKLAEAETAAMETNLTTADNAIAGARFVFGTLTGLGGSLDEQQDALLAKQAQRTKEVQDRAKQAFAVLNAESEKYIKEAMSLENKLAEGKKKVEKTATAEQIAAEKKRRAEEAKRRSDNAKNDRKRIVDELEKQFNDQLKLQDEFEKSKIELIQDARQKELAAAQESLNDYKENFLSERTKDEKEALDKQFINGKIKRAQYDAEIAKLREDALKKLTDQEREILMSRETKLLQDLQDINKKFNDQEELDEAEKEKKKKELRESFLAILSDQFEKETQEAKNANDEQLKNLEDALKAGAITQDEANTARIKLVNDLADKEKEITDKKNEYIKEQERKAREEQLKGLTDLLGNFQKGLDGLKQLNDLVNEIDQARLNRLAKNREDDLAAIDAKMQAELNKENLSADQKEAIEQKFAKQKYDIQKKAFDQEDKINRAKFNRDKALRLAQVGIDTASAIVKGIAQFGPPPSPAGIAAIASASILGLTQALAIMNQQYQSGTAPTPPSLSSGGAGSLTGAGASTFSVNTNAQTTDLTGFGQGQEQGIPVSQVVVLESDITGTQNKVKLQEAKSSF